MTNPTSPNRNCRPQFTLRLLLIITAVIGIGLMVYRWPWTAETSLGKAEGWARSAEGKFLPGSKDYEIVRRNVYRRDWRGQAVKHGLEQSFRNGELWQEAHYYDGVLHGPRRVWDWNGEVAVEANYRAGVLHGPYRTFGLWPFEGRYDAGKWDGEWRGVVTHGASPLVPPIEMFMSEAGLPELDSHIFLLGPPLRPMETVTNYRQGKLHGKTLWRTLEGELLNTAEYADDNLVAWNGQPIVAQFLEWLGTLNDPTLVSQFAAATAGTWQQQPPYNRLTFDIDHSSLALRIAVDGVRVNQTLERRGSLAASLCELAANQGCGFDYRYGGLWMVPREIDPSPPFIDPTGVLQIEFPMGSQAAQDWRAVIDVQKNSETPQTCIAQLLAGTAIVYQDRTDDPTVVRPDLVLGSVLFRRSRRDALAYLLYQSDRKCELENGVLVIRMREGHEQATENTKPFEW
ncbi:toxin-antitoxin system YwqK family antitoxin [Anatilimnocola floriformis]|uniref:toxin-antitoxin system YwqK family antitoxin n=1 Tax=Anatilimnocola floriformis TaxID=2948575 RepID=UPI0020C243FA|nr:hypothetical protein [Anatilimnocola floriformis]